MNESPTSYVTNLTGIIIFGASSIISSNFPFLIGYYESYHDMHTYFTIGAFNILNHSYNEFIQEQIS